MIPVVGDLGLTREEMLRADEALRSGRFVSGRHVEAFEGEWSECVGADRCKGVSSGTTALTLLLTAARLWAEETGFGGRRVMLPATSFVATLEAALSAGLDPLFVDTDEHGLMAPDRLNFMLSRAAREVLAVVPVHLYGQVAHRALDVADLFDVPWVIEDACQAHGARYPDGDPVGSRYPAAWSFMPAKILGAAGDAGAMTWPNGGDLKSLLLERAALMTNHGRTDHGVHDLPGANGRMDEVQAAVLRRRLESSFGENVRARHYLAAYYNSELGSMLNVQQHEHGRVWSYYAAWTETRMERDDLREHLRERGVATGVHYSYTLPSAFDRWAPDDDARTPAAERAKDRTLTLPLWPTMHVVDQEWVIEAVREFYGA